MNIDVSRDWCLNMAILEDDAEIGAGVLADIFIDFASRQKRLDPEFENAIFSDLETLSSRFMPKRFSRLIEVEESDSFLK